MSTSNLACLITGTIKANLAQQVSFNAANHVSNRRRIGANTWQVRARTRLSGTTRKSAESSYVSGQARIRFIRSGCLVTKLAMSCYKQQSVVHGVGSSSPWLYRERRSPARTTHPSSSRKGRLSRYFGHRENIKNGDPKAAAYWLQMSRCRGRPDAEVNRQAGK
jgi:hypothetical protein